MHARHRDITDRARFVASVVGLVASGAAAQPTFQGLGDFAGGAFAGDAWRISESGDAVAGSGTLDSGLIAARWTPMDGLVRLGRLQGYTGLSFGTGISGSGRVVVGYSAAGSDSEAFRWAADGGLVSLGDLPGGVHASQALNVSTDGATVVGVADNVSNWPTLTGQAFRWNEADGMVGLGYTQAHHDLSMAYAVSADGTVVTGASGKNLSDGEAFLWTEGVGMVGLGDISGGPDNHSVGADITPDGSVVVGVCSPAGGYEAFRWTQATGMVPLGDLPGGDHYSYATGVTADGSVIVGAADWDGIGFARAFIWDASNGMRELRSVLESEYGLDLSGWSLLYANDITADGSAIVGVGINPAGETEAWLVRLRPAGCPADFNGDGTVDTRDVLGFLNAWTAGC